jgi:Erythromycin esterase
MAETLEALMAHLERISGPTRAAVWAHNSHVGDTRATKLGDAGELNVGQLAREHHGAEALLVGFTTYAGTVTAASDWGRARPETERQSHYFEARLSSQFDAVVHLDRTTALEPLERTQPLGGGRAARDLPLRGGGPARGSERNERIRDGEAEQGGVRARQAARLVGDGRAVLDERDDWSERQPSAADEPGHRRTRLGGCWSRCGRLGRAEDRAARPALASPGGLTAA